MLIVQMGEPRTRWVVGCMTGTSLDGLDAALVEVRGTGLAMSARLERVVSLPMSLELQKSLRGLASGEPAPPLTYLKAARALGEWHAEAVGKLIQGLVVASGLSLVAAHGQTIWHAPAEHLSWQLFDPWPVVRRWGVPVVYDLRQADLVAGGQGAPITPLADWVLFRDSARPRVVVNLGGICNVTWLPAGSGPQEVRGEDIGPCNLMLDGLVRLMLPPLAFDEDGKLAGRGGASSLVYRLVKEAPFFQRPRPRSTGREDFTAGWVEELRAAAGLGVHDLLASACAAVGHLIDDYVAASGLAEGDVVLAGGGVKNKALFLQIRDRLHERGWEVLLSDALGVPAAAREAMEFAVLGALAQDGVAITLPGVTGVERPGKAGAWAG